MKNYIYAGVVLAFALITASCISTGTHYRLPQNSQISYGAALRIFRTDDNPNLALALHGKLRSSDQDEYSVEWTPWVWDLADSRSSDEPLGSFEVGWTKWFQAGAEDGGFYYFGLSVLAVDDSVIMPDIKTSLGIVAKSKTVLFTGNINTSLWKLIGSAQKTGGFYGAPEGGWAGILPFAMEAGVGYQAKEGGALVVGQIDKVPSLSLEGFFTP